MSLSAILSVARFFRCFLFLFWVSTIWRWLPGIGYGSSAVKLAHQKGEALGLVPGTIEHRHSVSSLCQRIKKSAGRPPMTASPLGDPCEQEAGWTPLLLPCTPTFTGVVWT